MTEAEIPREHQTPARRRAESVVVVNTGDGKGKSTAAFGVVLRAVARDSDVVVVQFLKSGKWRVGEDKMQKVKHAHATGVLAKKGIDH